MNLSHKIHILTSVSRAIEKIDEAREILLRADVNVLKDCLNEIEELRKLLVEKTAEILRG